MHSAISTRLTATATAMITKSPFPIRLGNS